MFRDEVRAIARIGEGSFGSSGEASGVMIPYSRHDTLLETIGFKPLTSLSRG